MDLQPCKPASGDEWWTEDGTMSSGHDSATGKVKIIGKAIVRDKHPYHVLVAEHFQWPRSVPSTAEVEPGFTVAVAEAGSEELAAWIVRAINAELDGEQIDEPRPPGTVVERGLFEIGRLRSNRSILRVFAQPRAGDPAEIARCFDSATARQLADRLNAVLRSRS